MFFSFVFFHILCYPPQHECQNLLSCSLCLCYVTSLRLCLRLRFNPPLCTATSVDYPPFRYQYYCHLLTARCLLTAYPGIQRMVLCLCSSCPPFAMPFPFANSLNCAAVACYDSFISLSTGRLAELFVGSLARSTHASRAALRSSPSRTASVNAS